MKDYAAQELSQAAYCRQVGLSPATFSHWFRQLHAKGERPEAGARRQTFAEVVPPPVPAASVPSVVIHGSGGTKVEAAVGTDPVWLADLLKALAGV
jgi:hypothetical protein